MKLDEYQQECLRTGTNNPLAPTQRDRQLNFCLGLAGEVGETLDLIKKNIYHGKPFDREKLLKELGDIEWYLSTLEHEFGFTKEEVCAANVEKLRARHPAGFTIATANAKADEGVQRTLHAFEAAPSTAVHLSITPNSGLWPCKFCGRPEHDERVHGKLK